MSFTKNDLEKIMADLPSEEEQKETFMIGQINSLAKFMHDEYEMAAKEIGWETQESTRVSFHDLPIKNKEVMFHVAACVLIRFGFLSEKNP